MILFMYVCVYSTYVCMYDCMYVCICMCVYARMYVCMNMCIYIYIYIYNGFGQRSRYSDSQRAGRSGDRIPVEARFSPPVQTGPETHPAFYAMFTRSFPGLNRPGGRLALTTHPYLDPRLKKEQNYTFTTHLGFLGLFQGDLQLINVIYRGL